MANKTRLYRRLPGRGTSLAHYVRLYEGPDHFLQVSATGFTETYKRFYFRDIQAIIVEKALWHHVWSALWAGIGLAFMLMALWLVSGGTAASTEVIVLAALGGFFLLLLLLNLVLGPSCRCHVQTAVQTERLPTLKRLRSARRFVRRIQPILVAAQAEPAMPAPSGSGVEGEGWLASPEGPSPSPPSSS